MAGIVAFFVGPIGRWVAVGIAVLAWTAWQRDVAATRARSECQAEQLQKTLDEVARQRDAAKEAQREAEERAVQTLSELSALEAEKNAIMSELSVRGGGSCVIPDDVLERLRRIR